MPHNLLHTKIFFFIYNNKCLFGSACLLRIQIHIITFLKVRPVWSTLKARVLDPGVWSNSDSGLVAWTKGDFWNSTGWFFWVISKAFTFGAPDPIKIYRNRTGFLYLRHQLKVRNQKYKNKKNGFKCFKIII